MMGRLVIRDEEEMLKFLIVNGGSCITDRYVLDCHSCPAHNLSICDINRARKLINGRFPQNKNVEILARKRLTKMIASEKIDEQIREMLDEEY